MKHIYLGWIIGLMLLSPVLALAQNSPVFPSSTPFTSTINRKPPMQSSYQVQVYQPFTNTVPSDYSPVMRRANLLDDDDDDFGSGGATTNPGDGGEQSNESPLGSSAILLFFAIAYIACKTYNKTSKSRAV